MIPILSQRQTFVENGAYNVACLNPVSLCFYWCDYKSRHWVFKYPHDARVDWFIFIRGKHLMSQQLRQTHSAPRFASSGITWSVLRDRYDSDKEIVRSPCSIRNLPSCLFDFGIQRAAYVNFCNFWKPTDPTGWVYTETCSPFGAERLGGLVLLSQVLLFHSSHNFFLHHFVCQTQLIA